MIEEVVSVELPVHERMIIRKNRLRPQFETGREKRVAIVSGIHGDELEGQYVCYEVIRKIQQHPEFLEGIVDIYPCLNPLGMDAIYRNVPKTETDMNRIFPGNKKGTMMEYVAACIVDNIIGSDICIDVHSSDTFIREIPQVRLRETYSEQLLPFAKLMNVDMIWTNATRTVDESTLAYSLNMLGVPAMIVEMGIGNHINKVFGNQVVDGIFNVMKTMGVWHGEVGPIKKPLIPKEGEIEFIRANRTGVFIPAIVYNQYVKEGQKVGEIVEPLSGECQEVFYAKKAGMVFSLREYPMIYEGALIARIISGIKEGY